MPVDAQRATAAATLVLAVIASLGALYFSRPVLVPISFGLLLATLLRPVTGWMERRRVPAPVAAAATILVIVLIIGGGIAASAGYVSGWIARAPQELAMAKRRLAPLGAPFARLSSAIEGVSSASPVDSAGSDRSGASDSSRQRSRGSERSTEHETPAQPAAAGGGQPLQSIFVHVFGTTASILSELVEVVLIALFVLAAGGAWRRKLTASTDSPRTRRTALEITEEMGSAVTRYVLATALINVGQGVAVALAMWALGMPSPILWALLTFVFEFVPYLGGLVMMTVLALTGLATFDNPVRALAAPAVYLGITTLQNNVVSPVAYGKQLSLNPAAILIAVLFWWSLWGVAGAFLAVPFLAAFYVVAQHVESLRPVAIFLEG